MAYTKYIKKSVTKELNTNHLVTHRHLVSGTPDNTEFYEMEPGVVLDVIRDENHPIFSDEELKPEIYPDEWPDGFNSDGQVDYSWIGRVKVRLLYSQNKAPLNELSWVLPVDGTIKEYPLLNETIIVTKYVNNLYYTRRLNSRNFLNNSADFRTEPRFGANNRLNSKNCPNLKGALNSSNISKASNKYGQYLGKYFKANNRVRPLKNFEGDTIVESRFGSSIRFGCYEDNPEIDAGSATGSGDAYDSNLGNPMIIIRNRQHPREGDEETFSHTILEDINKDGSSIHITSGKTLSKFAPTLSGPSDDSGGAKPKGFGGLSKLANSSVGTGIDPANMVAQTGAMTSAAGAVGQSGLNLAETAGNAYVDQQLAGPMAAAQLAKTGVAAAQTGASVAQGASSASGSGGGGGGTPTSDRTGPTAAAQKASQGDWSGSIGSSMGTAVGQENGAKVGGRLGNMGIENASKLVNVEGVSTGGAGKASASASIGGSVGSTGVRSGTTHSIGTSAGKKTFMKGVGLGNFSLNSTYESGIIGAVKTANKVGKSTLLKKTKAGRALSAASSLGIGIPGAGGLGINSGDSSMFKIFKLASFGVRSICAGLKNKNDFGSDTEESLGWLLSFGINLELLALLMAIFDRLRNLKFNFGSMFSFDLDSLTFDLCDWMNQVEFGSSLTDTLKGEAGKMLGGGLGGNIGGGLTGGGSSGAGLLGGVGAGLLGGLTGSASNKDKTNAVGKDLSAKGTLGAFTKRDSDFGQQFQLITDEEKEQLKASGMNFGSMGLSLKKGNSQVATMGFDPLTGLLRKKSPGGASTFSASADPSAASSSKVASNLGAVSYMSGGSGGIQYGSSVDAINERDATKEIKDPTGTSPQTSTGSTDTTTGPSTTGPDSSTEESVSGSLTPSFGGPESSPSGTSPSTGGTTGSVSSQPTQGGSQPSSLASDPSTQSSPAAPTTTSPSASNGVQAAPPMPDSVNSFHTGEKITAADLAGTPLAGADLNAVACLAPADLAMLKDTKAVADSIQQANDAANQAFDAKMEAAETEALAEGGGELIFGGQLPKLDGNQIILNSDRVLISSKVGELVSFSKGKYAVATDGELTLNAVKRIVTVTSEHTSLVSPTIHLGEYVTTRHPALKGDAAVSWLGDLCGWLGSHTHHDPYISTSSSAQQGQLSGLKATLPTLLSTRVFLAG